MKIKLEYIQIFLGGIFGIMYNVWARRNLFELEWNPTLADFFTSLIFQSFITGIVVVASAIYLGKFIYKNYMK